MKILVGDEAAMAALGEKIGSALKGGEVIELVGDVGAGKTTLTKSIAAALGIDGPIQSPTFTICNRYEAPNGLQLAHYDFYRLTEPGVMREELDESLHDLSTIVVLEWGDIVADVLGDDRLQINITPTSDSARELTITGYGTMKQLEEQLA